MLALASLAWTLALVSLACMHEPLPWYRSPECFSTCPFFQSSALFPFGALDFLPFANHRSPFLLGHGIILRRAVAWILPNSQRFDCKNKMWHACLIWVRLAGRWRHRLHRQCRLEGGGLLTRMLDTIVASSTMIWHRDKGFWGWRMQIQLPDIDTGTFGSIESGDRWRQAPWWNRDRNQHAQD